MNCESREQRGFVGKRSSASGDGNACVLVLMREREEFGTHAVGVVAIVTGVGVGF